MKAKKCKRCGKKQTMPFHTCAKPDPIKLGEELAEYVHDRWSYWKEYNIRDPAVEQVLMLAFERDFWRNKVLNS